VYETYVKIAGAWTYLYRAVASTGDTIDFMLSPKLDLTQPSYSLDRARRAAWRYPARSAGNLG
jgi:transposase-like protein